MFGTQSVSSPGSYSSDFAQNHVRERFTWILVTYSAASHYTQTESSMVFRVILLTSGSIYETVFTAYHEFVFNGPAHVLALHVPWRRQTGGARSYSFRKTHNWPANNGKKSKESDRNSTQVSPGN